MTTAVAPAASVAPELAGGPTALATAGAAPRATVVGGVFDDAHGVLAALRALRGAGATGDVVGFAMPLDGDPTVPGAAVAVRRADGASHRSRRPRVGDWLMTFLDPHRPVGQPDAWARGRTGVLAKTILNDLTRWLVGVSTFRVPAGRPGDGDAGVWVLGRPNHAAAVHRSNLPAEDQHSAAPEGPAGALATLGVRPSLAGRFADYLAAGASVLTTCETDPGRARRDERLLLSKGGRDLFTEPLGLD